MPNKWIALSWASLEWLEGKEGIVDVIKLLAMFSVRYVKSKIKMWSLESVRCKYQHTEEELQDFHVEQAEFSRYEQFFLPLSLAITCLLFSIEVCSSTLLCSHSHY